MIFKREELEKMGISLVDEDGFDRDLVDIINEYEYKKIKDDKCKFCTIIYDDETVEELSKEIEYNSRGYLVKDKDGDYSIDMIPRGYEVHSVVLNVKYCPVCGRNLQNELSKEIKDENNKFTITNSISIKDIFKYESRFSGSDEFDEL